MDSCTLGFNPDYGEQAPSFEEVSALKGEAVIEFGAPWCQHCQAAEPAIQRVLSGYHDMPHIKVFDGKGKPLGRAFKVKLWPTVILLQDGIEVRRIVRPSHVDEVLQFMNEAE